MIPQAIIAKKQEKKEIDSEEWDYFFNGYMQGYLQDYQMSAFLMACYFNGLTNKELTYVTRLFRDSGKCFKWLGIDDHLVIDKHSTGGIGDKTSLIILPLCILEGLKVPMISGRGLGYTGGTVDKLESIPGFNMDLTFDQCQSLMDENGGFFLRQTHEIAPLDKKIYALRDATNTTASIPLIIASILSKKLAEGLGGLVLDVKFGSGAFFSSYNAALSFGQRIKSIAHHFNLPTTCLFSAMSSPLGHAVGNRLEVLECLQVMKGNGPESTRDLSLRLASLMVHSAYPDRKIEDIEKKLKNHLQSGKAYDLFAKLVRCQGGRLFELENGPQTQGLKYFDITAETGGYIKSCDGKLIGYGLIELGGGRKKTSDEINPDVGIINLKHIGDEIQKNGVLATIISDNDEKARECARLVKKAYRISDQNPEIDPLIKAVI